MTIINVKNLKSRDVLPVLEKQLLRDNILVIIGSRQVGKTSLLALLYESLSTQAKIYFDLEDIQLLNDFNKLSFNDFPRYISEKAGFSSTAKRVFVFIDEIQYLDNPSAILKYAFDHFKHIKLIVSGSSSLEIKKKFSDRLTGRKFLQILSPIGFSEFLRFQGKRFKIKEEISFQKLAKSNLRINDGLKKAVSWAEKDLSVALQEFVLFGGYPKVALIDNKQEKVNILKEIYSTYVRKDIKDLAEIENIKIYNDLIEILASQTANLLNIDELASTLSANRKTLEKYLFLLENTFIIGLLRPFYTNKRKEITKMPKIFMEDTGLRNMLLRNFNGLKLRPDKGPLIENFVYTELKKNLGPLEDIYFWRTQTQAEVDFVIKGKQNQLTPVEVKYQKLKSPQIPSGLRAFIEAYKVKKAFVITENFLSQTKTGKTTVYFLPAYLL